LKEAAMDTTRFVNQALSKPSTSNDSLAIRKINSLLAGIEPLYEGLIFEAPAERGTMSALTSVVGAEQVTKLRQQIKDLRSQLKAMAERAHRHEALEDLF
jgi:hypothetical protein